MIDTTWSQVSDYVSVSHRTAALASFPNPETSSNWSSIEKELLTLRRLEDDWDGLGARAPALEVVDSALMFIKETRDRAPSRPPNRVLAGPLGEIVFEWQSSGSIVEAEIERVGVAEIYRKENDGSPEILEYEFSNQNRDASWHDSLAEDQRTAE
jgi:hypothetical protein